MTVITMLVRLHGRNRTGPPTLQGSLPAFRRSCSNDRVLEGRGSPTFTDGEGPGGRCEWRAKGSSQTPTVGVFVTMAANGDRQSSAAKEAFWARDAAREGAAR